MIEPTHVFAVQKNSVKVVTKLYGEVSQERLNKAYVDANHRLDQLQPYVPEPVKRTRQVEPVDIDEYDEYE